MPGSDLRTNPDALPSAATPRIGTYGVNGIGLYAEVRGSGPPVLLIGAADEDAEVFRPVAERLPDHTVVTYDRRGTLRSGRDDWPGAGSAQHADDAAGLLQALNLEGAVIFGASAGGIVALQTALRHPEVVDLALVFEPGYFRNVPAGKHLEQLGNQALADHLASSPQDWAGAVAALGRVAAPSPDPEGAGFFTPPEGKEWYSERGAKNAEAFVRGDIPMSQELLDEADLAETQVGIRFAFGTASMPIFRDIATHLSAIRGATPDRIHGVGHAVYYHPDIIADYIRTASSPT